MTRAQLEHVIRAAATIADDDEIVVLGSQAVLGQFPDAPAELLVSDEADVYPKNRVERSDLVDGSIGELSPFHDMYGYYAQGVGPETATLPSGWQDRLVIVESSHARPRIRRGPPSCSIRNARRQRQRRRRAGSCRHP
jgi:hypothetical protein